MYEYPGLDFEYGYDIDAAGSHLVLKLNSDVRLLKHQVEIICQNPNTAFVSFNIKRENENTSICYNITSKISLSQYLGRKKLNKKELLDLLRGIVKNLMLHGNYLLDISSFVIHPDFIFINPATAEVSLLYVPVSCDRDATEILKAFLKDLVVNSANVDDNAGDNYLQRILNYLKSDSFSLGDFNRLLLDLRNKETNNQKTATDVNTLRPIIPKEKIHEDTGKSRTIRSIMLLQPFFLITAAAACIFMVSRKTGDIVSIGGVLLIAAALDILAIKRISGRPDKREATIYDPQRGSYQPVFSSPDVLKACDTVMVSKVPKDCRPYLESIGAHRAERVMINKDKFIIGRLGSMADHIMQGSTVGKLHAEITVNGGLYYIKDLNSKNGTFVNDVRIPSNKEYEIRENDRIRFSSFEYVFRQQEA
ncbi:MAG: DUF6382 domain-containing protein [Clostridiaceae bacterium]|jgi:hypothetical protein|nr:DUF6382 domain-containing protein [Clostridiaceae bacterium]